jgi:hypothetical protein
LILSGELLLPFFEELGILALEWAHKTLDFLYEDVLGLEDDASKKASAWTGFLLIIVLIGWGCHKLHQLYQRTKVAFPQWWTERMAEMIDWWASLPWLFKLAYIVGSLGLIGILALFI